MPRERYQQPTLKQTKSGSWFVRVWVDAIRDQRPVRVLKTLNLGKMGKREAQTALRERMATINHAEYVITSQIPVGVFLDEYQRLHVNRLAPGGRGKYESLIKNHIRPAFEKLKMVDLTSSLVQQWLDSYDGKLSWATRTDMRNVLSGMFTKAIEWGRWKDQNPMQFVHAGRKRPAREKRKMSDDQMRHLLAMLPVDLRLAVCVGLFCTLRVSEIFGLQEKHLNFAGGVIQVRQRWYRGDLDVPKNERATRDVPMGYLAGDLHGICKGEPERFVFQVETHPGRGGKAGGRRTCICRDDRGLNQHFLRPAAKALGFYWPGFGWHSFRREAITAISASLGIGQAMKMAGHGSTDMNLLYTLTERDAQDRAVRDRQESLIGQAGEKVN